MHEIGVQTALARADSLEQRVRMFHVNRVPADLRDFQRRVGRLHLLHVAGDPAESSRDRLFQASLGHQLHADADAEERTAVPDRDLLDRLDHARHRVEPGAAVGIGAHAWQHDAVGAAHPIGIGGQLDLGAHAAFARGAFERLGGRAQIARAVVDNGNPHVQALPG